ncbi:spore coat protein [Lysinibacillus antri]|uniref:Spore coat protein n=2 Tax=Bacillaceae TaxID=186817 RepID=A0A432L7V8_9BACI|nr:MULTISPECIES: spore coat protein [Lysinibacillus]RUL48258.1 spore coat protein [Lysinibacillus antri]TSI11679.1 spore coat protein [Lysinibacillus sp. BW-2-10]
MTMTEFRALDHWNGNNDEENEVDVEQEAKAEMTTQQQSYEWIIVKDSEYVDIHSTDTQAAISLQLGIQAAIAAVISVTIGDSDQGKNVADDIKQFMSMRQRNTQKTIIENSKGIHVTTHDTDLAVNIQAMLQILVSIVAKVDIF